MTNQSKLQLFLLEIEQHNLLLIATTYKFKQLKKNKQRKHCWWVHDINRNQFQQGAYHNLVTELQFDGEKFQQHFRLPENLKSSQIVQEILHILDFPIYYLLSYHMNHCIERFSLTHRHRYAATGQIISEHMEALSSVYMFFHFCCICIPRMWNLSFIWTEYYYIFGNFPSPTKFLGYHRLK